MYIRFAYWIEDNLQKYIHGFARILLMVFFVVDEPIAFGSMVFEFWYSETCL